MNNNPNPPSNTPRTDAEINRMVNAGCGNIVTVDFAPTLERELKTEKKSYDDAIELLKSANDEKYRLRADLRMCTKALALISKGIGSNHAALMAFEALDNPRIQAILNEK